MLPAARRRRSEFDSLRKSARRGGSGEVLQASERQPQADPWLGCAPGLEHGMGLEQGRVWAGGFRTWSEVGWVAHVPLIHSF